MDLKVQKYKTARLEGAEEILEHCFDPVAAPVLYEKDQGPQEFSDGSWRGGTVLSLDDTRERLLAPHKNRVVTPDDAEFNSVHTRTLMESRPLTAQQHSERVAGIAGLSRLNRALEWMWPLINDMPYGWWTGGFVPSGPPAYAINKKAPGIPWLMQQEIFCAGVPTLDLRAIGKRVPTYGNVNYDGGVYAYGLYFRDYIEPFRLADVQPGDLLIRYYRDVNDQGHVAVVLDGGYVLQSFDGGTLLEGYRNGPGLNKIYTVRESHAGWYYEGRIHRSNWINYQGDEPGFTAVA